VRLTHGYYKYPARFGDAFVKEAVTSFSRPGEVVLDPFCGGGTTLVEALASGRRAFGSDVSALALFVARAKTTPLSGAQLRRIGAWTVEAVKSTRALMAPTTDSSDERLLGLHQPFRNILVNLKQLTLLLPRGASRDFARCLLLKTAQWAFDGKESIPSPTQLAAQVPLFLEEMAAGMRDYAQELDACGREAGWLTHSRKLIQSSASRLSAQSFGEPHCKASLVVTSPPYLGVHVLYNKWQLAGRKELRAAFYLADCDDLGGAANYTIVHRAARNHSVYYSEICKSFQAVSKLLASRAYVIQLVSFSDAEASLPHYLSAMNRAGLELCDTYIRSGLRWREVPGRRWYARVRAIEDSSASREVLLVHRKKGS
jgi:hypothetical protein